ncbi:MAG TPA: ABC transporter ATP-binding protein [Rhodothermales bacterium]|nr:ABC transporter ATP-binding protein [Rhodothermales bacterium]
MIKIENLYKSFADKPVLKGVSLEIYDRDTMVVIGRSGSGKSVLLKHLIGLLQPDRGRILVDGIDINKAKYRELRQLRKDFGVLFQGGALFDSMDSFDNVAFPLRTFGTISEDGIKKRVHECLDLVNLPDVGDKRPSELSGGMQKRVALARAISLEPRYILYDEPTSGLDPETSNTIDELIRRLDQQLNVTSIVITHDMHSVLAIADRIAFIHEGEIRWTGTVDDLHNAEDEVLLAFVRANEYQIGDPSETADLS